MSCKELITSLKKAADEKVLVIRHEVEQEAGAAKADVARRLEQRRDEAKKKEAAALRDANAQALSAANNRAREIRLAAEKELSARLEAAAASSLSALRKTGYETAFRKMAQELPALAWHTVRVNPEDVGLAKKYFPGAEIVPDPKITGGMDVSMKDGSIRVINTFEKRMERAWSDMLPLLIRDVYGEGSDGTPAAP
jgi:V/A-type H+/Na+-transporting ATPase subunit E